MRSFNQVYYFEEVEINKALCLPFEIEEVLINIEYRVSKYYPATRWEPEEGGEIEETNITVLDDSYTERQKEIIIDNLDYDVISKYVWRHFDKVKYYEE
jgi:hypothetical protein